MINRDKEREEQIHQEQKVDDKKIAKRDGFLYLKVKMTPNKMATRLGLVRPCLLLVAVYTYH